MAAVTLNADISGLARLQGRIDRLANLDRTALLAGIGAEVESQTRRRIEEEKAGPDGQAWPEWSDRYARGRHGGHSLLIGEGDLLDSIRHEVTGGHVEIGSNLVYAAIQQFGGEEVGSEIPARPYLGLSPENEADVLIVVEDFLERALA